MPPFLSMSLPQCSHLCIATITSAVLTAFCAGAFAADVLVVTDSHYPVKPMGSERIIELDRPVRIEAELSAGLPTDLGQATALARRRLSDQGDLRRRMREAYQDVAAAWSVGIAKIPAIVVDRHYVVYGEPDVSRALARIQSRRSTDQSARP